MKEFKNFMEKSSGWKRFLIFYLIALVTSASKEMPVPLGAFLSFVSVVAAGFWLWACFAYKTPKQIEKQKIQQLKNSELELRVKEARLRNIETKKRIAVSDSRKAKQEENHGRVVTRLAGVTFDNPDGSSRQTILEAAYEEDCVGHLQLDTYIFNGADAIRVLYDGFEIGNIPRDIVPDVLAVFDRIVDGDLFVEAFHPEEEDKPDTIYRADITIIYNKDEL